MTTPAEVIARINESMERVKAEEARLAARAAAYTGPERRRGRRDEQAPEPQPAGPAATEVKP